jgi:hypothetical protein
MNKDNLVSIQISADDLAKVNDAVKTLQNVLMPYLVTISTEERKTLPKMSEKTVPFVKKVLEYCSTHPEFAPTYLSIPELQKDVDAFDALNKIGMPFEELSTSITDTTILAGSEAYIAALSYYNSVKQAVKMNQANAKVIFDDLKVKFEEYGVKTAKKVTLAPAN